MQHVLVVEDLQIDRFMIKKELSSAYQVTTLSSATEAGAFARSHSFDIALINVMLRDNLDSITLLHELQSIRRSYFLPIAISCYVDDRRYYKLNQAGFVSTFRQGVI